MNCTDRKFLAYLDELNIITILLPLSYHGGVSSTFYLVHDTEKYPLDMITKNGIVDHIKYVSRFSEEFLFEKQYWVVDEHGGRTDLQIGAVIRTERFDEKFYYTGNDLGATLLGDETQFKLWAPTAIQVKLKITPPQSSFSEIIKLKRGENGVWSVNIPRNLELFHYSFLVLINQEWREAVDPYVKAVTVNGEYGVIIKRDNPHRPRHDLPPLESPVDAIIYETHIRDFSIHPHSGIKHKGLYLGAGELHTKGQDGESTGLSYVKELGITHLEFLPFHDYAGVDELTPFMDYNWGYNPLHFNAPEGSYSTNPSDPYSRMKELKSLIDQIHQSGLRVIMDVVYNHVFIRENSPFEKIVPGYYFRHNELGMPSNGTGVGNDIASERKMVRKFIIDSIRYWMEEYHIDGFRFDLMGILDVETMTQVRQTCDSIAEGTLIIGEGWNLNTPLPSDEKATISNQAKLPQIAQFNDKFRDTIKGSTFNLFDKGYALGNEHYIDAALEVLAGSIGLKKRNVRLFNEPYQSVNYVECHDNHTLWDKLQACLPHADDRIRAKYHRLATGLVLLSQGIPFLHSGQEFFRTKQGEGNSYCSPDRINQLDWERKIQYKDNVNYLKGLIAIRRAMPCFRMRTAEEIRSNIRPLPSSSPILACSYQMVHDRVIVIINPSVDDQLFTLPKGDWSILADQHDAGIYSKGVLHGGEIKIPPISLIVLLKK
ncbi:pullulanase [Bacillus sp. SORGH_AS 510]|uniref:type I pullulanase n=1 Tax=Bacillus sp. SORGH_AS_0510 TaxID=3041771 RepID=UPI002788FA49|nr:type I pullulanase [Bacillus sp. SORGH_AS_0510]MDQ1144701.1 pullulanase [Bacillus sp. SORGH_AS_0510]